MRTISQCLIFAFVLLTVAANTTLGQGIWTVIDSIATGELTNRYTNPFSYDPTAEVLAVIYKKEGRIRYTYSSNDGTTWLRVSMGPGTTLARYPSLTLYNIMSSANPSNLLVSFSAPVLTPSIYGHLMYGVDELGQNMPFIVEVQGDGTFWSSTSIWSGGARVLWMTRRTSPHNDYFLWRTHDYATVHSGVPPSWTSANFLAVGRELGGRYHNQTHYVAAVNKFTGERGEVWNLGYSKSTDNGETWSSWTTVRTESDSSDWRDVPGIAGNYHDWFNNGTVSGPSFAWLVDGDQRVHFFGVVVDTITNTRALVELYETPAGWNSRVVQPNLGQTANLPQGYQLNAAATPDGSWLSVQWLDAGFPGDTLADIWLAWMQFPGTWVTTNLTHTPHEAELYIHLAPVIRAGPDFRTWYFIRPSSTGLLLFGSYTIIWNSIVEGPMPPAFELHQNYPNPFNPSTRITYELPHRTHVRLSVTNVLGQTVKILVDEERPSGRHHAWFDATGLASGVYFYRLEGEGVRMVRKMILLR